LGNDNNICKLRHNIQYSVEEDRHLNLEEDNATFDILLKNQGYSQKASREISKWYVLPKGDTEKKT
jgi:regulator of replication initiation timing